MTVSLTIVVDNKAAEGLVAEHGYSLYVENRETTLLFDTGNKNALIPNMNHLGLSGEEIDNLVLSHGHYDHSGGVAHLLHQNRQMELYLHSGAFQPRYTIDGDTSDSVRMGLVSMEAIHHHPDEKIHWLSRPSQVSESIGITGPIPRKNTFEDTGGPFYLDPERKKVDTIDDDVAMWIRRPAGLVICLGCCHSGLINTLEAITSITKERRIAAIIGGLHLLNSSSSRLEWTVAELANYDIGRIVACHCSGDSAVDYLAANLDTEVGWGMAGMTIRV